MPESARRIPRLGWAIAFVAVTTLIAMAWVNLKGTRPTQMADLPVLAQVPEFTFTSQTGAPVSREDLLSNVWVVNFIFTRCPSPCPIMSDRMMELQKAIQRKGGDVKLVTVTVDPAHDTPEVLASYAAKFDADPAIWSFLTGDPEKIEEFVIKGMLQPLATDPTGVPSHSQRFLVVDAAGGLRSFHDLDDPELMPKLLMDIGKLLREFKPKPKLENPS
jgi:protein SCO1/2